MPGRSARNSRWFECGGGEHVCSGHARDFTGAIVRGFSLNAMLMAASLSSGCVHTPATCGEGRQPSVVEHIYFGAATPDGEVTAEQWTAFLNDTVTPRFPGGLTSWQADGQWRSTDGSLTRESSRLLNLIHPGDARSESSVLAIIDAYKTRYRQEAVMRVTAPGCVSF